MIDRATKLRLRRKYRRSRRQVEDLGSQAEESLDKHFFDRLVRLFNVRRFVAGWVLLILLLIGLTIAQAKSLTQYYQKLSPLPGGVYVEGMQGLFTNSNPIYAVSPVDNAISELVFAGLLKIDGNNQLAGDLAESWKTNPQGDVYTVKLKPNLSWHDGQPLTAQDVVFTYKMAQHPDSRSALFQAWRQVEIKAIDDRTVTFSLKNPIVSFIYSLTTGIIPKHKLSNLTPDQLRSASFNTINPVGSGPFVWQTIETVNPKPDSSEQRIGLKKFDNYHGGAPKLDQFIVHTYATQDQLNESFKRQSINAIAGLDKIPPELANDQSVFSYETPVMAATMAFFRTDNEILKDNGVRQALIRAVNIPNIISTLDYPVILADEPVLKGQFAYDKKFKQLGFDEARANRLLDEAGWKRPREGEEREKDGKKLSLKLYAQDTEDFSKISSELQKAWRAVGVGVEVILQSPDDLSPTISSRAYDILLSGITIGTDPDVFVYWHSSQADSRSASRLNFSNYKSKTADTALEASRSRLDQTIRKAKMAPFLEAWKDDAAALGLFQPRFIYLTRGQLFNYNQHRISHPSDRFWNVHNWMIRQGYRP